ncbi:GntR family transcriptional regulator [Chelativorans intermedius]|uniref:GntR family transcriptional regulator n=1 Tax=Chelativorans intermedius TaxID=515947 RepID=A0ABV6D733_9HYPH|nr:GntR family transcriptional regulator [Chelativorans intermedius]MCT8999539.1 GntR family transcriptional regulator [Chelativorans intermedius]
MSKSEDAFAILRRDILDAVLAPGEPLVIAGLRQRYGFGWTPLREALPRLEAEKLVVFQQHRGYRVAPVSAKSLRDLQAARLAVESALLKASIENGDGEWEGRIVAAHHLLGRTPAPAPGMAEDATRLWEQRHDAFHDALLAAGESEWLTRFQRQIADQLHRHHRFMVHGPNTRGILRADERPTLQAVLQRTLGIEHHTALMEATLARDAAKALALLEEHIGFSLAVYETLWPA